MQTIQATPKEIRKIFSDTYIIPDFQRAYSWDIEQCAKLFDDITDFFMDTSKEEGNRYYLGNIVVYEEDETKFLAVIDGQQRLTTMLLFLNALFSIAQTVTILEECLKGRDELTGKIVQELKIQSFVFENDKKDLEEIILVNNIEGNSRLKKNYRYICERLSIWKNEYTLTSEKINEFILTVLDKIVLLPIQCGSMDDALTIFHTLNNRGLPLGDADIFKANMFKNIDNEKDKKELKQRWNSVNKNENIEKIFRYFMHIKRAEEGDINKEIGMRKYFDKSEHKEIFKDWRQCLHSLEKVSAFTTESSISQRYLLSNLYSVLSKIPHEYCLYPVYVFWYKNAINKNDEFVLPLEEEKFFEELLIETIRYYYMQFFAYRTINTVRDTTYRVCKLLYARKDYISEYRKEYTKTFQEFERKIKEYDYGRYRKGLVFLLAVLNKEQNQKDLYNVIGKAEVEHILPSNGGYNNYNGWTEQEYSEKLNTLGNFVLLEKSLNIRASNDFFKNKKTHYINSVIQEANDLNEISDWTYDNWKKRNEEKEEQLFNFFKTN